MQARRLIHSSSNATILRVAAEWLAEQPEALIVAASRAAADELVWRAADRGFLGIHRLTLTQLAAAVAAERIAAQGLAPLSRLAVEALAARVTGSVRKAGKLGYFDPVADAPGFARALASTLAELRLAGIPASALEKTGAPGADLARLLLSYEEELKDRRLADLSILLRTATEVLSKGAHRLAALPLLLLDVTPDSAAHQDFLAAVVARAPAVLATARSGDEEAIRKLEVLLGVSAENGDSRTSATRLDHLRRQLFAQDVTRAPQHDATLDMFSSPGEGLESVEMARRILQFAAAGVPFDRIAVLLRNSERYQPLVEEALRRAGVPACFSRGTARPDAAGRAFLALLGCAAERCSASRFAEYLSLGQVPRLDVNGAPSSVAPVAWAAPDDEMLASYQALEPPPETDEPAEEESSAAPAYGGNLRAPFGWEKLLVDAAVIGGRERWQRRLRGLEQEFRLQFESTDKDDQARRRLIGRQIEQLSNLERFALPLVDELSALPERALWGDWLDRLARLAAMSLRNPDTVLAVLAGLQPMADVGPVGLDEVREVLAERLRFLRNEPPARRFGRVFVGSLEEARGREFDVVFLPGLAEGLFPRRAFEDPLLLDVHRAKLTAELRTRKHRAADERRLLAGAAAATETLVASYPRMDVTEGRPRVPSFYALELPRAAEGRLPELRVFEKQLQDAAPSRLDWPAPKNAAGAIDDAEYDLVMWSELARGEPRERRGLVRYMLEANPHLARSLRARWLRWNERKWSSADGIAEPDAGTLRALASFSLSERPYSPSTLQHFATCPYQFLLYGVHQLRARQDPVYLEQMDPLTRGALFHAAQFALFQELKQLALLPLATPRLAELMDIADRVLDRVAREHEERLAPAIPRVWRSEVEDLRMDLRGWLRRAAELDSEWMPSHFEFAFGMVPQGEADKSSTTNPAVLDGGAQLRGSIDLVEKNRRTGALRITDHKTGKLPDRIPAYVGGGTALQPLLYALAAEKLFGKPVQSGRLFYCTQRGAYTPVEIALTDAARIRIRRVLETIDDWVRNGFLPAAPRKDACETCDYRPVCGPYEERRVKYKEADRLDPLIEIRAMP